jgi:hypothetical protein
MVGTLLLERFNGRELYPITSANLYVRKGRVLLRLETGPATEQTTPEGSSKAKPSADVWLKVDAFDPAHFAGSHHRVPRGEVDRDFVARLYYFDHMPIDDNEVHVVARKGNGFHVTWSGVVEDPDVYSGKTPKARLTIDAVFVPGE